ncbi:peptidylprolyl isomerase, partial [Rhizobium ruizarguesonis]
FQRPPRAVLPAELHCHQLYRREDEVKARYDKEVAALTKQEEVHARHIIVKTEDEAKDIIKQLDAGKDFAELAKEKSTDPTKSEGGDLG